MAFWKKKKAKKEGLDIQALDIELLYKMLETSCNCGMEVIKLWLCDTNSEIDEITIPAIKGYLDSVLMLVSQIITKDPKIASTLLDVTGAICDGDKEKLDSCMETPEVARISDICRMFLKGCKAVGVKGDDEDKFAKSSIAKKMDAMFGKGEEESGDEVEE